ncbi:magnetosome protein MamC [Halochromatium glycolicum]|uniref:magnetosome protein MamC n=1 Tax=Halochromatium glycolicum TaxID=85075 RepID=UPI001F5BF1B8|nr:magnetosome protein MamC [Halochromatium glycolicum]
MSMLPPYDPAAPYHPAVPDDSALAAWPGAPYEPVLVGSPVAAYAPAFPYPPPPPPATQPAPQAADGCASLAQLALLGAVIGGSAAAGANLRRLQRQEVETLGAFADTGRAALATATATAVAGAAASAVSGQGLVRLGVLFASGTAVMYGIQRYLERGLEP